MSEVKQVIVVRKDLNMRKGKIAAQCAHASMKVILDRMVSIELSGGDTRCKFLQFEKDSALDLWINGIFTKIVVSCDSETELLEYYSLAESKGIPCALITDSGLTEFNGIPTNTCIAIGPWYSIEIDEITSKLKLL